MKLPNPLSWSASVGALFFAWLLQFTVIPRWFLTPGRPDLVFLVIAIVILLNRKGWGPYLFAATGGLMVDLITFRFLGLNVLLMLLVAVVLLRVLQAFTRVSLALAVILTTSCSLMIEVVRGLMALIGGISVGGISGFGAIVLTTTLYNGVMMTILFFIALHLLPNKLVLMIQK